jgi:SAM-dependent methyltransferase
MMPAERICTMGGLRQLARRVISHTIHLALPHKIRAGAVKALVLAEEGEAPSEAVRHLLALYDYVEGAINSQCVRWGNGVHVKHELMDGIHAFFYERIRSGAYVLDIGCGNGAVAYAIATHAQAHVLGVDMNAGQIAFARQHFQHPNLRFEAGDVTQNLPAASANIIVLSSVLEHLPNRVEFLQALMCKFRPELFLVRVPAFEHHFFAALKRELGLFPYRDPTHLLEYSPALFVAEMQRARLDVRYLDVRWGDIWAECVPHIETQLQVATKADS